jgi:murein DD-endopeptidase MepM/ murein hydrolase activator NlpD
MLGPILAWEVVAWHGRTIRRGLSRPGPTPWLAGLLAISLAATGGPFVGPAPQPSAPGADSTTAAAGRVVDATLGPEPPELEAMTGSVIPPLDATSIPDSALARDVAMTWPAPEGPGASPRPVSPAVVRFRPRGGETGISRLVNVSVRFSAAMDRSTTETAFRVTASGRAVAGSLRWAEADTVLVLDPALALPAGALVELSVGSGARSASGVAIARQAAVSFTVERASASDVTAASAAGAGTAAMSTWRWPLLGPITQRFGETRTRYGLHQGIDIDGATGDRVVAARGGRVIVAGRYDTCGGLEVHIDHGAGFVSWYRHLSRVDVSVGAPVAAGRTIGLVGDTGCSLGSHLHFAIRLGPSFVDPLRFLPER